MNQNYYPIDFQAQYEETSEKMIQISKKYKDAILTSTPDSIQKIQAELQDIQQQLENRQLLFRKQSIYSQFASGQLMAQKRKQPPQMCPECGQELKKPIQCEFCAQLFCKKCCSRNRVIPFVSKEIRLCCEPCHWKFVKLFDNKQFYEEKEKLINVISFVRNKTNKIIQKLDQKRTQADQVKNQKRQEKIKEKTMEKKLQEEQKKLKLLEDQFRKAVTEKAQRIREAQKRKQKQQQQERERAKRAQQERIQREEKQWRQEAQRKQAKERQQAKEREEHSQRQKYRLQQQKLAQLRKRDEKESDKQAHLKSKQEQQLRKKNQQIQQLKRMLASQQSNEKKIRKNSGNSIGSKKSVEQIVQTPKQTLLKQENDKQKLIDTATTSQSKKDRSRRQSQDVPIHVQMTSKKNQDDFIIENSSYKVSRSSKKEQSLQFSPKTQVQNQTKKDEQLPQSSLERSLANMLKMKKDEDAKSVSNMSKQSKQIIDMSVNQLLGLRIPVARITPKIQKHQTEQAERDPNDTNQVIINEIAILHQEPKSPLSPHRKTVVVDRTSIKLDITEQVNKEQIKINRDSIIRNSSLMSSTKENEPSSDPSKCTCEIM